MRIRDILFFKVHPFVSIIVFIFLIAIIGYIDFITGYEISLSAFYSIPVICASWFVGIYWGVFFSVFCMFIIVIADYFLKKYFDTSLIFVWNNVGILLFYFFSSFVIGKIKIILKKEMEHSRTDSLTGIANSRYFAEAAEREVIRCQRYNHPISVVFIDCDNFKHVNDKFGHSEGDKLLLLVAKTINENVRKSDIAARIGGDEFCVLMPETGIELSLKSIEDIRKALLRNVSETNYDITFSIGVATFIRPPKSIDELIKESDKLMYQVKRHGKDNIMQKIIE